MQVTIKPAPDQKKWHGKEGKDSFARPKSFSVLYDDETGGYATGLTPEETIKYSALTGMDLTSNFRADQAHPFWDSPAAVIKLPNHTMILDDKKPMDFIKIKNMKASKLVANSLEEYEKGLYPDATHVIYDEAEEVKLKSSKIQSFNRCIVILSKMSKAEKTNMMALLSEKTSLGRSEEFVDVELDKVLNDDENGAKNIENFLKFAKMDKAEANTRAQIIEAIHANIIQKKGHTHEYMGEPLGFDYEDTVKYFLDPNNQNIKIAILEKLNDK